MNSRRGGLKRYLLYSIIIVVLLIALLLLAPGTGSEDPFVYQFF